MSKHTWDLRRVCICSDCDGRGTVPAGGLEVECQECGGTGEVTVQPLDDDPGLGDRMFAAADRARRLVGGEDW